MVDLVRESESVFRKTSPSYSAGYLEGYDDALRENFEYRFGRMLDLVTICLGGFVMGVIVGLLF